MTAYYNEIDPQKAACLREFIKANLIAPGEVDERSIKDVAPADLRGFTQCHFFAGFGVWSYALRLAGWPDDRPVWTGSCPCQPFSAAGKREGHEDERHLWPTFYRLIRTGKPQAVFGEQVSSSEVVGTQLEASFVDAVQRGDIAAANRAANKLWKDGSLHYWARWIDSVSRDLEAAGYSFRPEVLGAHSVGAPHIRQRLYFCAHAESEWVGRECGELAGAKENRVREISGQGNRLGSVGCDRTDGPSPDSNVRLPGHGDLQRSGEQRLLAEDGGTGECADAGLSSRHAKHGHESGNGVRRGATPTDNARSGPSGEAFSSSDSRSGIEFGANATRTGEAAAQQSGQRHGSERTLFGSQPISPPLERHFGDVRDWRGPGWLDPHTARSVAEAGATRGFWADCDWWHARDGKWRPIEPGIQPLAHGAAHRVLKLRGYGDAIIPQVAAEFIVASDRESVNQ